MKTQLTKISIPVLVAVVVVYLIILQGLPFLTARGLGAGYGEFPEIDTVVRGVMLPVGVSILFAVLVITSLGWWRPVLQDDHPVERWGWIVWSLSGAGRRGPRLLPDGRAPAALRHCSGDHPLGPAGQDRHRQPAL